MERAGTSDAIVEGVPDAGTVVERLDEVRADVEALLADRQRLATEARRHQQSAEGLAGGLGEMTTEMTRLETECQRLEELAQKAEREQATLADRLQATEAARQEATRRAEAAEVARDEAQARAAAEELARTNANVRASEAEAAREAAEARARDAEERTTEGQERTIRLTENTRRLHTLYQPWLPGEQDHDALVDNILEISVDLSDASKGAYLRAEEPFEIVATENFDEARTGSPLLTEIARRVVESREPLLINDPEEIAAIADDPLAAVITNVVAYPIVVREELSGVVVVANKPAGPFTGDDTRLLLGIGSHASTAVENGNLRREMEATYSGTIALLCDVIEAKDPYTHGHCDLVARMAVEIARDLSLSREEQRMIFEAGLMHDVGKIAISDGILLKQGPLLPAERDVIETHATIGADLVTNVPTLRHIAPVIRYHHEHYDGTGYPDGLAGEDIPLLSRILGVADAYEAMRATRPYRAALDPNEAYEELRQGAGTQFDSQVVELMLRAIDRGGPLMQPSPDDAPQTTVPGTWG
jgi:HD-GYP domain-containing protein (c-di-GMP phosphodiesterase class II)